MLDALENANNTCIVAVRRKGTAQQIELGHVSVYANSFIDVDFWGEIIPAYYASCCKLNQLLGDNK